MKSHERILELHSLLSKLLDSLCFELTINKNDDNCLSLLEYALADVESCIGGRRAILAMMSCWNFTEAGWTPSQSSICSAPSKFRYSPRMSSLKVSWLRRHL